MGIGAYRIRETIRTFGGDVEVTSEVNRDTAMCLQLPLAKGRIE
mgnify:CR=1 FL=1